jgi:phage-related minor tail protein
MIEASVTVAETERAKAIKEMQEAYAKITGGDKGSESIKNTAKIIKTELSPELMRIKDASEMIGSSFENAFMSVKEGTMSVKDAFNSMANDIINELYRIFVVKQITGFITSAFTGAFNPASAAGTGGGVAPPVAPRAMGGPVSGGRPYMVGERGPELVVPSRNGHVMPNNQLGGGTVVVNQNINVATGVQQTVRAEVLGLMPQIAEASKAAVLDARRRGGAFAGSF